MIKPRTLTLAGATLALALPLTLQAEEDRWYLAPSLSYVGADSERQADDGAGLGLAIGKAISEHVNLELAISGNEFELENGSADIEQRSIALNALYLLDREGAQPYLLGGIGGMNTELSTGAGEEDSAILNLGLGVMSTLSEAGTAIRGELGYRGEFVDDNDKGADGDSVLNDWYVSLGLQVPLGEPTPTDIDGDGIADPSDSCPDTPLGRTVDNRGCELDSDGDGVVDSADNCASTPSGAPVDAMGCEPDSDGDGVLDSQDNCPDTASGIQVGSNGCELDRDGDGVVDSADNCPGTPGGRKVDARGCQLDSDGDGVVDGSDACPDTLSGLRVDARGCAKANQTISLEGVNFASGSGELTAGSTAILNKAATTLRNNPLLKIEIAGHTDSRGAAAYNQQLSQKRAESVLRFLATKGVDSKRLSARGYGESQPVADNTTAAGRASNRRVELRILK